MRIRYFFLLLTISILFLAPRLYNLKNVVNFGSDQGIQLLEIYNLYKEKRVSLIGPYSSFSVNGKYFFFGPAPYYISMPVLASTNWNPLSLSYFLILLQLTSLLYLFHIIYKVKKNTPWAILIAVAYITTPLLVRYSQFYWNPNFHLPISTLLVALLLQLKSKNDKSKLILIGFLLGFGMQFHYSYALAILSTVGVLVAKKVKIPQAFIYSSVGFIVGFLPILLFELRHNFYNTTTLMQYVLQQGADQASKTPQLYYFFSVIPFLVLLVTYVIQKLCKKHVYILYIVSSFYCVLCLSSLAKPATHGFGMVDRWNFEAETKVAQIIEKEKKTNYSIVDLLTGDTRAMAIRYLLTIKNNAPVGVIEYPKATYVYVYSTSPIETILKGTLWELDVVKPLTVINKWHIQNGVYLYLLERAKPITQ